MSYIMALDAGTTSATAASCSMKRARCAVWHRRSLPSISPSPAGWSTTPMRSGPPSWAWPCEAMNQVGASAADIAAIGITNQRETTIVWDKTPASPFTTPSSGSAAAPATICDELEGTGPDGDMIRKKTGLVIDAYFSATKLKWILDNVPGARETRRGGRAAVRHGGDLAHLEADRRHGPCDGLFQRLAAPCCSISTPCSWDDEILEELGHPQVHAAGADALQLRLSASRPMHFGGGHPHRGRGGRPAGGALRPDLL